MQNEKQRAKDKSDRFSAFGKLAIKLDLKTLNELQKDPVGLVGQYEHVFPGVSGQMRLMFQLLSVDMKSTPLTLTLKKDARNDLSAFITVIRRITSSNSVQPLHRLAINDMLESFQNKLIELNRHIEVEEKLEERKKQRAQREAEEKDRKNQPVMTDSDIERLLKEIDGDKRLDFGQMHRVTA